MKVLVTLTKISFHGVSMKVSVDSWVLNFPGTNKRLISLELFYWRLIDGWSQIQTRVA